jgi:hypothetical protein
VAVLSRIHHPVSATPAATISINTKELQIIGAEELKQEVCKLLVENANLSPIVNIFHDEAKVTKEAGNRTFQYFKESTIGKTWCKKDYSNSIMAFFLPGILGYTASCQT